MTKRRINITLDPLVYARLKQRLAGTGPWSGLSEWINDAIRAALPTTPTTRQLDAAYRAAARESWRRTLAAEWRSTDLERWPR